MAAAQKLYPRGTVKRIVKAHSNRSVSKNADILVRSRFIQRVGMVTVMINANRRSRHLDIPRLHAVHARVRP